MTPEEYRAALHRLSPPQFERFRQHWGGAKATIDECVQEFVYAPDDTRQQSERVIIFWLRTLGIHDVKTEDQKILDVAKESAQAAKESAAAAKSSATSSSRSAVASSVIATLSLIVSVLTLFANLFLPSCRQGAGVQ